MGLRGVLVVWALLGVALAGCGGARVAGPSPEDISIRLAQESASRPHALVSEWCVRELARQELRIEAVMEQTDGDAAHGLMAGTRRRLSLFGGYDRQLQACLNEEPQEYWNEQRRLGAVEKDLGRVAYAVGGRKAPVSCETHTFWYNLAAPELLGYVFPGKTTIHLAPRVCYALHRFRFVDARLDLSCLARAAAVRAPLCGPEQELLVEALAVVAHEAQHARGVLDEATAECYGVQNVAIVARMLGLGRDDAQLAAFYAWRYPFTPPSYHSPECRPGGKLDRHPKTRRWP